MAELFGTIVVSNMDEAALLALKSVFHRHPTTTAITMLRHIQRCQIEAEANVVKELLR